MQQIRQNVINKINGHAEKDKSSRKTLTCRTNKCTVCNFALLHTCVNIGGYGVFRNRLRNTQESRAIQSGWTEEFGRQLEKKTQWQQGKQSILLKL